ncbi:MAG: heavy metal-responsive transcriptional regulator [Actinomycetota bacterium]
MRIGELGRRTDVSTKTIRYYESLGLLDEPERTASGYRQYGEEDVERLQFVRDAQATGLSLAEIASVLELKSAGERSCSHTRALLERHLQELDLQIERLRSSRQALARLAERAARLDPATCTDPNRCQVITSGTGDG